MTSRIKRICITRKVPRKYSSTAKNNAIDLFDKQGNLLARFETWKRKDGGVSDVQVVVHNDPEFTQVSRVDDSFEPDFPKYPALVLPEHPCPQCEDGSVDSGGFEPWGSPIEIACPFCKGSGKVIAAFYPNP